MSTPPMFNIPPLPGPGNRNELLGLIGSILGTILAIVGVLFSVTYSPGIPGSSSRDTQVQIAPAGTKVRQGDNILVGDTYCTLSYIDINNNVGYTAAHCAENTDQNPVRVVLVKDGIHQQIGTASFVDGYNPTSVDRDIDAAVITFEREYDLSNDITHLAPVLAPSEVHVGDSVCTYGATTHTENCSRIFKVDTHTFTASYAGTRLGDSGGPAWIVDDNGVVRGIAGLTSYISPDDNGTFKSSTFTFLASAGVRPGSPAKVGL
jgi:hypothetical protein